MLPRRTAVSSTQVPAALLHCPSAHNVNRIRVFAYSLSRRERIATIGSIKLLAQKCQESTGFPLRSHLLSTCPGQGLTLVDPAKTCMGTESYRSKEEHRIDELKEERHYELHTGECLHDRQDEDLVDDPKLSCLDKPHVNMNGIRSRNTTPEGMSTSFQQRDRLRMICEHISPHKSIIADRHGTERHKP